MPPVKSITILYDADCGLCTFAKDWIRKQTALVGIEFLAAGSPEAQRAFPQVTPGELAVVANTGEVWLGDRAWVVCLWALREHRGLAFRLTGPALWPVSRHAFVAVSKNRLALSSLLRFRDSLEMEHHLRRVTVPQCQTAPK
jgi:predicted DCC family thiol-disulfide oxidoreductase YuxK